MFSILFRIVVSVWTASTLSLWNNASSTLITESTETQLFIHER